MLYHVHFSAEPHEPFPPLDDLAAVEATDPMAAVHALVDSGRYPQDERIRWARVVLNTHPNGRVRQVWRVPITAEKGARLAWDRHG